MTDDEIAAYYTACLTRAEPWAKADWGSANGQVIRWRVLREMLGPVSFGATLLDVGCGLGGFGEFWQDGAYTGWEAVPEVAAAGIVSLSPHRRVVCRELLASTDTDAFDYVVASGLFTYRDRMWMRRAVARMWALARRAVAFNCLSTWGPQPVPGEFQADPLDMLAWGAELTARVALRHDYLAHDFTVCLWKP